MTDPTDAKRRKSTILRPEVDVTSYLPPTTMRQRALRAEAVAVKVLCILGIAISFVLWTRSLGALP